VSVIVRIHPVIVLITVQGLFRITNRAGKLLLIVQRSIRQSRLIALYVALFAGFLKQYFCKNLPEFGQVGSRFALNFRGNFLRADPAFFERS
jgi:hypothetical protein